MRLKTEENLARNSYCEITVTRPLDTLHLTGRMSSDVCVIGGAYDYIGSHSAENRQAHRTTREQIRSSNRLLLASVGMPMTLAGEEFGDC